MAAFNESRHPLDRRQLIMYRTLGEMPANPSMHLCAHLYASDRNSLYIVSNHLNMGDTWTQMASLAHTVIFHTEMQDLWFSERRGGGGDERWYIKEDSTDRVTNGRGTYRSRVFSPSGVHVASVLQDGMIRLTKGPQATEEEVKFIRATQDSWPLRETLNESQTDCTTLPYETQTGPSIFTLFETSVFAHRLPPTFLNRTQMLDARLEADEPARWTGVKEILRLGPP
ncbi:Thioesterase/thiol ester dehydrase-isomerase [Teratosphaeria nubilosa]|uniref:Thioesterase/thiol ester dehydrase-isomerase n=1 Tax=Teratosphaeria nubilosa TaxID=161662 RepID=A0A6G1LK27_9PEZI|nr:Thioesterase/thiol ester dehydrase-isomerase [Teratosphaeria nubilosa]